MFFSKIFNSFLKILVKTRNFFLVDEEEIYSSKNVDYPSQYEQSGKCFDLYIPKNITKKKNPVLVFIHGGAWKIGDKSLWTPYAVQMAKKGFVCLNINYRLNSSIEQQLRDIRDAIIIISSQLWCRSLIDLERICLIGASAGAHLAMLMPSFFGEDFRVKCIVDYFGPVLLSSDTFPPTIRKDIKEIVRKSKYSGDLNYYSPIHKVTKNYPPTILLHGKDDKIVPHTQSVLMHKKLLNEKVMCQLISVNGSGHSFHNLILSKEAKKTWEEVEKFIVKKMRKKTRELVSMVVD